MTEYIDRELLLRDIEHYHVSDFAFQHWVEIQPAADVVPVVRCKDCKYWQDNNNGYPHQECRWSNYETPDPDDYCSYGEMRKDREYIDNEKKGSDEE